MKIEVNAKAAQITERETLTVGSKGIMIAVSFSPEWDGLNKTALFWDGENDAIPVLMFSDFILLPPEMTATKTLKPLVTFVGKNAEGTVVFPAVECPLGSVWYGIRGGKYPIEPPTPDWIAQVEAGVAEANRKAQEALDTVTDNLPLTERAEAAAKNAEDSAKRAEDVAEKVKDVGQQVELIKGYANDAKTAASSAEVSATTATAKASEASASADNAKKSETAASGSAEQAKESELEAHNSAQSANASAQSASDDAQRAQTAAANAEDSQSFAQASQVAAAKSEQNASKSEMSASGSAEQAQTDALTAQESAKTAIAKATEATEQAGRAKSEADRAKTEADRSVSLGLTGASVGQIAEITKVDASGKPIEWMPVDKPSGGGGTAFKLIRSFKVPDDPKTDMSGITWLMSKDETRVTGFRFTTTDDGSPFIFNDFVMTIIGAFSTANANTAPAFRNSPNNYPAVSMYRCGIEKNKYFTMYESKTVSDDFCIPTVSQNGQFNPTPSIRTGNGNVNVIAGEPKYAVTFDNFFDYQSYDDSLDFRGKFVRVYGRMVK